MKSLPAAAAALALLAAHPALAQSVNSSGGAGDRSDSRFVDHVARDGQAEIDLAHLASKKTQNTEVKALARRLAADHTKANQQLMKIAQKEGMSPASSESKSASKERPKLEKLDGQAFDQAFVKEVVQDHHKDINYVEKQQPTLQDPQLKSFAPQTLSVLQQHLEMAQEIAGGSGSSSGPHHPTRPSSSPPAR
jgi:putative membrane protein